MNRRQLLVGTGAALLAPTLPASASLDPSENEVVEIDLRAIALTPSSTFVYWQVYVLDRLSAAGTEMRVLVEAAEMRVPVEMSDTALILERLSRTVRRYREKGYRVRLVMRTTKEGSTSTVLFPTFDLSSSAYKRKLRAELGGLTKKRDYY